MPRLESGGLFPPTEDLPRLERYSNARKLYDGLHHLLPEAKRVKAKLAELHGAKYAESVVYIIYNLPRLICCKFADLQILRTPQILIDGGDLQEEFNERLREDIPDLWARVHDTAARKRAYGDAVLLLSRGSGGDSGALDLREGDVSRWFPVLSSDDPLQFEAHQMAWIEDHGSEDNTNPYLRVDVFEPGRVIRTAYSVDGTTRQRENGQFEIKEQVDLGTFWAGLKPEDIVEGLEDFLLVHIPHGKRETTLPYGRGEFEDSASIFDDINWRLATWSDANDKVAHPPRVVPEAYLQKSEESGVVTPPSKFTQDYIGRTKADPADIPSWMGFDLSYETLERQFETSLLSGLIRHEMAPSLLGLQFGREKESGEAKALGMGTTDAATRRDLLQFGPAMDRALTTAAYLAAIRKSVSTFWRVGLPKPEEVLLDEVQKLQSMGMITDKEALQMVFPQLTEDQINEKLEALKKERQEKQAAEMVSSPFSATTG